MIAKAKDVIFKLKAKNLIIKANDKATNYHKRQHLVLKQYTALHC